MKKFIALTLSVLMLLCCVACGDRTQDISLVSADNTWSASSGLPCDRKKDWRLFFH